MSVESKKGEGTAEELGGKLKKGFGKLIGDDVMAAEGAAKELKGRTEQEEAKAEGRTEGAIDETIGAIKNRVGKLVDSEKLATEGRAQELSGEEKKRDNS
jgi:uncharacterized protein YjbJ (UPF0337 family)